MLHDDRWIADVIGFWFDDLRPKDWWRGSTRVDDLVRTRFADLHAALVADPPRSADLDGRGHLATVLVFDQFSRHLYRDTAASYAFDPLALATALDAIDRGLDRALPERQRHFVYMPLMHSEDAAMQERSLDVFATLSDRQALASARDHRATIARFGRFPSRNAALGRTSTDDERAFLEKRR